MVLTGHAPIAEVDLTFQTKPTCALLRQICLHRIAETYSVHDWLRVLLFEYPYSVEVFASVLNLFLAVGELLGEANGVVKKGGEENPVLEAGSENVNKVMWA